MAKEKTAKKSTNEPEEKPAKVENKKSKKGWFIGLATAAVAVVIGVVVALVINSGKSSDDIANKLSYSNAFFISDGGKYSLWNAEGKKLSEDEFTDRSSFVGGYAFVEKDDQYGIISDSGKMSVGFGKYGYISPRGGLYLAQDGNTGEYFLITGAGKELARGKDLDVYYAYNSSGFAAVESDNKIKIFNYAGRLVSTLEVADDAEDPKTNGSDDFGLLYYAGKNVLFDARTGEVLAQFDGSQYAFEEVSSNRQKILLENDDESGQYKLVADKKVYDLNEMKYYGFMKGGDILLGYDTDSEIALLNNDYKVAKKIPTYLQIKDTNDYAFKDSDGKVEVYRGGTKIKEYENATTAFSGVVYEDLYAIKKDDKVMFYHLDGNVAINHEYKEARLFDKHHLAVVSDDGNEYYLINTSGNAVNDLKMKKIAYSEGGYEFKNNDNKYTIANQDGRPVTEFKYSSVYYRSTAKPRNIWTGSLDNGKVDVIDADKGTVLVADVDTKDFYDNYFSVKNGEGKTEYYTYTGVKFYTSK